MLLSGTLTVYDPGAQNARKRHLRAGTHMKFELENPSGGNLIRAYETGVIVVNEQRIQESLIVTATELHTGWAPATAEALTLEHLEPVRIYQPEVLLLGTGKRQVYPDLRLLAELSAAGMGVEVMDTASACRTYNILLGDKRRVAAALMPIGP